MAQNEVVVKDRRGGSRAAIVQAAGCLVPDEGRTPSAWTNWRRRPAWPGAPCTAFPSRKTSFGRCLPVSACKPQERVSCGCRNPG